MFVKNGPSLCRPLFKKNKIEKRLLNLAGQLLEYNFFSNRLNMHIHTYLGVQYSKCSYTIILLCLFPSMCFQLKNQLFFEKMQMIPTSSALLAVCLKWLFSYFIRGRDLFLFRFLNSCMGIYSGLKIQKKCNLMKLKILKSTLL